MSEFLIDQKDSLPWGSHHFSVEIQEDNVVLQFKYRLLVFITVVTGLLMWTYSLISLFLIEVPDLARIGVVCSVAHAFSPLLYRVTRSMKLAAYLMVTAGIIFQFSFSYFTGGFYSTTLVWFAILPMIVGLLTNRMHATIWTLISASAYVFMFWLQHSKLVPESALNDMGQTIAQFLIGLGLISLVGGFTLFFLDLSYFYHKKATAESPTQA